MEKLAQEYYDYMSFRAKKENTPHELEVDWYFNHLRNGFVFFFGVYNDNVHLVKDIQNPQAFKAWKESQNNDQQRIKK